MACSGAHTDSSPVASAVTQWRQLAIQQGLLMPGWQAVRSSQRTAVAAATAATAAMPAGLRVPSAMQRRCGGGDDATAQLPMRRSVSVLEPLPRSASVPSLPSEPPFGGVRSLRVAAPHALPEPAQPHECGASSSMQLSFPLRFFILNLPCHALPCPCYSPPSSPSP